MMDLFPMIETIKKCHRELLASDCPDVVLIHRKAWDRIREDVPEPLHGPQMSMRMQLYGIPVRVFESPGELQKLMADCRERGESAALVYGEEEA